MFMITPMIFFVNRNLLFTFHEKHDKISNDSVFTLYNMNVF